MENLNVALVVLVTGLVVVFSMLILLTAIIKIYSTIVYKITNRKKKQKPQNNLVPEQTKSDVVFNSEPIENTNICYDIPLEIVAAISAAVIELGNENNVKYKINSIKRSSSEFSISAWAMAGRLELTKPF